MRQDHPLNRWGKLLPISAALALLAVLLFSSGCAKTGTEAPAPQPAARMTAQLSTDNPPMLNIMAEGAEVCPPYVQEDLKEPAEIRPIDGVLETQLIVAMKKRCVPVFDKATSKWTMQPLSLRTYGFPRDHSDPITGEEVQANLKDRNIVWSAPGPTLHLDKASGPGKNDGTNLKFTLYNALDPQADPHACDELKRNDPKPQGPFQPNTPPNCFHGDNSTNFHFHGSHVSPQEHQDFVGLELLPFGATKPEHAVHTRGELAIGKYSYNFDRLRYTQPEGSHWYHAHKHGSTALQVLNGLVGTALIFGEFDRELEALFTSQGGLPDRLLVVQQLQERPSGLGAKVAGAPLPLINGQADPIVRMKPGQIQRWRFVGATMQASAQLDIGFRSKGEQPEVRQIAMDGVQFAPENYECQPIFRGPDCLEGTEDDSFTDLNSFTLPPGNRIDILIKAPRTPGNYAMSFKMSAQGLSADVMPDLMDLMAKVAAAQGDTTPHLLTLVVEPGEDLGTAFPTLEQFPKLPPFLADIGGPFRERTINYEMVNQGKLDSVHFTINGRQYDPACANETLTLNVPEEWTLTNNSGIAHPFHIHTNPFQLISELKRVQDQTTKAWSDMPIKYNPPYVWRDTEAIPIAGATPADTGQAVMRYVAHEFTGEFVNHCHILGHEDRGMMQGVQASCPNGQWGKPTSNLSEECVEGNYREAAPICK